MKKHLRYLNLGIIMFVLFGCTPVYYAPVQPHAEVVVQQQQQPIWVPAFDDQSGINYYYFPDYAMYYDVRNSEYVYMENGNWFFSHQQPPVYASIDLNSSYVVALNVSVHQPWMHHSLYVSHYPPYYYRSYYHGDMHQNDVRGFNENGRKPVYRPAPVERQPIRFEQPNNRSVIETAPSRNVIKTEESNRNNIQQQRSIRTEEPVRNNVPKQPERNVVQPRSQPVTYQSSSVGRAVKVNKNMMAPKQTRNAPAPASAPAKSSNNSNKKEDSNRR
jgi:hypothetical protein